MVSTQPLTRIRYFSAAFVIGVSFIVCAPQAPSAFGAAPSQRGGASDGRSLGTLPTTPTYTARVPFVVVSPPPIIGSSDIVVAGVATDEEVRRIIQQQQWLLQQEGVLRSILSLKEFHPDDAPGRESAWWAENKADPVAALKRDLKVVIHPDALSFEITMTTHNAEEAKTLVQAATTRYLEIVRDNSVWRRSAFMASLGQAVKDAESVYQIKSDALADYQKRHGIDTLKTQYEIAKGDLQALARDCVQAAVAADLAQSQRTAPRELSPEWQQLVDRDPVLINLMNTANTLEQDPATGPQTFGLSKVRVQIDQRRHQLTDDLRKQMIGAMDDDARDKRFVADRLERVRQEKLQQIEGMGQDLLQWQQKMDDLKAQADLLAKLRGQFNLMQANQALDDTRVAPVVPIADTPVPSKPD